MTMRLKGINATLTTFREVDRRFRKAAAAEIEKGAKDIAALARMFAPVDRGDLVKSIRAQRVNDANATKWRVKVGGMIGGRDVSAYAAAAHEGRSTNRKSWSLGKKSREKAQALGVMVGPGYLSRAYRRLSATIKKRASDALKQEVSQLGNELKRSRTKL